MAEIGKEISPAARQEIASSNAQGIGANEADSQYLTFVLGEESYGVDILRVQEIKGWSPVTRIPNTPEYLRGVLNLRGTIVPIIDMRMRFSMETAEYTPITVVIVVSVRSGDKERILGIVVDAVSDVLNVDAEQVKPAPDFGSTVNTEYLSGLVTVGEQMVMLLDIDKMLTESEIRGLDSVAENV